MKLLPRAEQEMTSCHSQEQQYKSSSKVCCLRIWTNTFLTILRDVATGRDVRQGD